MEMEFSFGRYFNEKNSRYEKNISPGISFSEVSDEGEVITVVMRNMNKSKYNWLIWNIPAEQDLKKGIPRKKRLENGAFQGKNDMGSIGYAGPKPPRGSRHRYEIKAYLLEERLGLSPASTGEELMDAIEGKVVDKADRKVPYKRDFDEPLEEM